MSTAADLLRAARLEPDDSTLPALLVGEIIDTAPIRVRVPTLDGGRAAISAFGHYPTAAAGDSVRLALDEFGELTIVAWEPA